MLLVLIYSRYLVSLGENRNYRKVTHENQNIFTRDYPKLYSKDISEVSCFHKFANQRGPFVSFPGNLHKNIRAI